MEGEISWFEGRQRKRPNCRGAVIMNELRSRQDASSRRRQKQKVHSDLYDCFDAEERTDHDQEVGGVIQEEHDQENEEKIVLIYRLENHVEIETINPENHAMDNQEAESNPVDNGGVIVLSDEKDDEEVIVIVDEENQAVNQEGVIEAREVIEVDEDNKVETYEPLPAMFQVNEPQLPENHYLYVAMDDWPMTWNYEEHMVWGLGLGSSPNPNIEYICGIGWVKKNFIN